METEHRKPGVTEFIPVAIGLVIAILVIVSVGVPIVNSAVWNASAAERYGATTGTILENVLPLFTILGIGVVAVGLMAMFR